MQHLIVQRVLLPFITDFITKLLTRDNFAVWLDKLFDIVEEAIADSKTKTDDLVALPLLNQLRALMNVPDND